MITIKQIPYITKIVMKILTARRVEGVPVIKDNDLLEMSGVRVGAAFFPKWGRFIAVDKHFNSCSPNAQEFVLMHEVGHIKTGLDDIAPEDRLLKRYMMSLGGNVLPEEQRADDYAFERMGKKAVDALRELQDKFPMDKELSLRIERLNNKGGN